MRRFCRVREMIASAAMMTDGIEWPAACYILAYNGDEAIGVVGVEAKIDAALIRSLYIKPAMRQRGIGAALLAAARKAAHTRGARHLYLFSTEAGSFFERVGFVRVEVANVIAALSGVPQVEHYRMRPEELAREV